MEDVSEGDDIEELGENGAVVEIGFDDENAVLFEELLTGAFERRVVVGVEVVEAENAVSPPFKSERAVRADKAGRSGD